MIVAILSGTPDAVRADLRALDVRRASIPAEVAAEIRLDLMDPPNLGVFENAPVPLIATCRRPRDNGRFRGTENERLELLRRAAARARWVDVEADVLEAWRLDPRSNVVASFHDFEVTSPWLASAVKDLLRPGVAFVKVATRARSLLDLMVLAGVVRQAPGRVVAIGLGPAGGGARILADRLGSAWTFVRFSSTGAPPPRELADSGVPDLDELLGFYRGGVLDREAPAFGVVGDRADESIGPKVFNRVLREKKLAGTYVHLKTPSLAGLREACRLLGIRGLSVTTPFKEAVLAAADRIDPSAASIGAANTLVLEDGAWVASNTDRDGIARPVLERLRARGAEPTRCAVLVVGAGGLGRAAAAALKALGCEVSLTSRGAERLREAAQAVGVPALAAAELGARTWDVIVNATPAGGLREPTARSVDLKWAARRALVVESNYRPPVTPLVREARDRGLDVITGADVYASQAAAQARLFFPAAGDLGAAIREATTWALPSGASS